MEECILGNLICETVEILTAICRILKIVNIYAIFLDIYNTVLKSHVIKK